LLRNQELSISQKARAFINEQVRKIIEKFTEEIKFLEKRYDKLSNFPLFA